MYNAEKCVIESVSPEELAHLRGVLPTIKMRRSGSLTRGYTLRYDPKTQEAMLFDDKGPITSPRALEVVVYEALSLALNDHRTRTDQVNGSDYSRFSE